MANAGPVKISYSELLGSNEPSTLSERVLAAFGPDGLGIVVVDGLPPHFSALRARILAYSNTFASLEEERRELYAAEGGSGLGWSLGREKMNGVLDTGKGSFYVRPGSTENLWPSEEKGCAGFQLAFGEVTKFLLDVGIKLAGLCESILRTRSREGVKVPELERMIATGSNHMARLLHYYPPKDQVISLNAPGAQARPDQQSVVEVAEPVDDSWCGTHIDNSCFTALVPAIYLFHPSPTPGSPLLEPLEIPSPSATTGLYIKTRSGLTVKASIPTDCIAFQTGECLARLSDGAFEATPHFVNANSAKLGTAASDCINAKKESDRAWAEVREGTVSRDTLALFMQPDPKEDVGEGEMYQEFYAKVLARHY